MLILLSPAKSLDFHREVGEWPLQWPRLLSSSVYLIEQLRAYTVPELATLMHLSDKLAALNVARYAEWLPHPNPQQGRAAVLAFDGDVYEGLQAYAWDEQVMQRAEQQLRMLSGLYGLLRPLDSIMPYRLEMGTALPQAEGKDLYAFWRKILAVLINADREAAGGVVVNLASQEYFKAVAGALPAGSVISPQFLEQRAGKVSMISFYAKKARGLMADWILRQGLSRTADLQHFCAEGYFYDAERSRLLQPVFVRTHA
ncbi:MAG: peroxide stress protein YaaA [Pseudomonadales bacterium]|nr:peroxide stress protein YaaA [Pseudomonadales bacterium]